MRYTVIIAAALLWAGGCGGDPPPAADAGGTTSSHVAPLQAPVAAAPAPVVPGVVAPPEGAQWTIYCDSFVGPDHVERADQAKVQLANETRMPDWHLVHQADQSMLYYGYYKDIENPQARADKRAMDGIVASGGTRRFRMCLFVPLDSPDPAAPPQWDLSNTPPNMFWSLQIADFRGTSDRKERAVEAVRTARAQGIEAYYFHGDTISSVCIGAWPKEAVQEQAAGDTAHNSNPDTPIIVANQPIPDGAIPTLHDDNGNPVPIFAPKLTINDPSLQKAVHTWKENADNGYVSQTKDVNGNLIPAPSFLVIIPHREALLNGNDPNAPPAPPAGEPGPTPTPVDSQDTSLGKLRTIGDH